MLGNIKTVTECCVRCPQMCLQCVQVQFQSFFFSFESNQFQFFPFWNNNSDHWCGFFFCEFIPVCEWLNVCNALDMLNYWQFFFFSRTYTQITGTNRLPEQTKRQFSMQLNTGKLCLKFLCSGRFFCVFEIASFAYTYYTLYIALCGMNV